MSPPNNWIKVKFEQIAENVTDRIDKPSESGLKNYIGLDHLDTDQIRIKRFGLATDVEATKFLCKKGDIIFGKRNAYLRKVAVTDRDAVVSAHSMVLRPKVNLIDTDFLPCLLQSSTFWKVAFSISEGSMSPTIKWKTLAKQEFMIPSIDEQKKIAKLLWAIEDNIEKTEKLVNINEKLKNGLLRELLTKGIGHKKFKKTEIGDIPEEWELKKLSEVSEAFAGGTPNRSFKEYYGGNIPWVKSTEVAQGDISSTEETITKEGYENSNAKWIPSDSTLIAMYGATAGKVCLLKIKATTNQAVLAIIPSAKINYLFLYYYMKSISQDLIHSTQGSGQPNLSKSIIMDKFIPLPSIKEQEQIVFNLEEIDQLLRSLKEHNNQLYKLKKKLTDELISGRLRLD